jgi:phospholipid/cholesterol/gamma-HCH transport system substrate-binding protein
VHLPGEPGGKVRVDLDIASRYADRIRKDSVARIETQGLLGDRIVEITVGTAATPALGPGEVLAAREPTDFGRILGESAGTVKDVGALVTELRKSAEALNRSKLIEHTAAAAEKVSRVVDQVERGRGWAHALLYEEPLALRKLDAAIATTQALLDRVERGQGVAGVLVSPDSTAAARRFVAAMDRLARVVDKPEDEPGMLPALLFDPKYKRTLEDLRVTARNLREISDRVAGGQGTLGALTSGGDGGDLRDTLADLKVAVHNLRSISEKIDQGDGTLGALVADPTLYERLVTILEGAQRSFLLRSLIRSLGERGADRTP